MGSPARMPVDVPLCPRLSRACTPADAHMYVSDCCHRSHTFDTHGRTRRHMVAPREVTRQILPATQKGLDPSSLLCRDLLSVSNARNTSSLLCPSATYMNAMAYEQRGHLSYMEHLYFSRSACLACGSFKFHNYMYSGITALADVFFGTDTGGTALLCYSGC